MLPLYDKYKQNLKGKLNPKKTNNTSQILTKSILRDQQQQMENEILNLNEFEQQNSNNNTQSQIERKQQMNKSNTCDSPLKNTQKTDKNYYHVKNQITDDKKTSRNAEKISNQNHSSRGFQNAFNKIDPRQKTLGVISLSQSIITNNNNKSINDNLTKSKNNNNNNKNKNNSNNINNSNKKYPNINFTPQNNDILTNSMKQINYTNNNSTFNSQKQINTSSLNQQDYQQQQFIGNPKTAKDYLKLAQSNQMQQNQNVLSQAKEKYLSQQKDTINTLLYSENLFNELFAQPQLLTKFTCNANVNDLTCDNENQNLESTSINKRGGNSNTNIGNGNSLYDLNQLNTSNYSVIQMNRDQNQRGHTMSSLNLFSQGQSQFTTPKAQKNYINKVAHVLKSAGQHQNDLSQGKSFYNDQSLTQQQIQDRETKYKREWIQDDSILDPSYRQHCLNNSQTQIKFNSQVNSIKCLKEKQGNNLSNLKSLNRNGVRSQEKIIEEYNQINSEQRINLYQSFNCEAKVTSYTNENSMNKSVMRYSEVNNSHFSNVNQDRSLLKETLNGKCIHNKKSMYCQICSRKINSNNQNYRSIKV